jgi:hypothetical protein
MAFAASNSSSEPRSFSIGPLKMQILKYTAVSGDTSGTVTCDALYEVDHIVMDGGLALTAAPTFSGNVATVAFTNPAANRAGTILAFGR